MRVDRKGDPSRVRETFDYQPDSGRLVRIRNKTAGKIGRVVGHVEGEERKYRRIPYGNASIQASWMVWAWHKGEFPSENLAHLNGDRLDDRIENLALKSSLRRPVQVAMYLAPSDQPETMLGDLPPHLNTGIYQITNINNGRCYVGSAVNVSKRWREHLRQLEQGVHHSKFMQRCWNKHGGECFVFRVIVACRTEDLIWYEQRAIDALKPDYNSAPMAGSQLGYKHSHETRKRMSASRAKDFSPFTGKQHTEETRRKISEKKKGVKHGKYSPERAEKAAEAMRSSKNAISADEARQIRSLSASGKPHKEVAAIVGRSYSAVADVVQRRTYKWVD